MKNGKAFSVLWEAAASMRLTIACLAALMVLVVACTLAQVSLGVYGAVNACIRAFWVYYPVGSARIPVFPGGGLVGLVLLLNLAAAQLARLEASRRKAGLWLVHLGLIILFVGEFATSSLQVESELALDVGSTRNYSSSPRELELAIIDATSPDYDQVFSIGQTSLSSGRAIQDERLPFAVRVKDWSAPPGAGGTDAAAAVELDRGGSSLGTWSLSTAQEAPQTFADGGRTYRIALRPKRYYLPFSLTLEKFSHDVYPGTDIPKNFSSLVRLHDPRGREDRRVVISMNNPLRYAGKAFYQASFGKNDTLSVLQVVQNPSWLLPYLSCLLVGLGLALHFLQRLLPALRRAAP